MPSHHTAALNKSSALHSSEDSAPLPPGTGILDGKAVVRHPRDAAKARKGAVNPVAGWLVFPSFVEAAHAAPDRASDLLGASLGPSALTHGRPDAISDVSSHNKAAAPVMSTPPLILLTAGNACRVRSSDTYVCARHFLLSARSRNRPAVVLSAEPDVACSKARRIV